MRLLLVGDTQGVEKLLRHMSGEDVSALCTASNRPQYRESMSVLSDQLGVPLLIQPRRDESEFASFEEGVHSLTLDLIIVNSYSMLIPPEILRLSRLGGVNIHLSLLPRNRGPNPIQWAMIRGEKITGVTMHEMTGEFDEGAVIAQREAPIVFQDTWLTLRARLDRVTDDLLRENLVSVCSGRWTSRPQERKSATRNSRRSAGDSYFSWNDRLIDIYRLHRAVLPPLPPAWSVDQNGTRIELTGPLTLMALMNVVWSERQIRILPWGETLTDSQRTEGHRVNIRPIRQEDSTLLHEWIMDQEFEFLNPQLWPDTNINHDAWIVAKLIRESDLVIFIIEDERGTPVGTCQLVNINWENESADLQFYIFPSDEERHLEFCAVSQLSAFGFADLGLRRINIFVRSDDLNTISDYEKIGFRGREPKRESATVDGRSIDVVLMELVGK